jgi:hypothetical protein
MSTPPNDSSTLNRLLSLTMNGLGTTAKVSKERIKQRKAQRTLEKMYWKLGKEVVELVRAGEIEHPGLKNATKGIEAHLKSGNTD